MKMSNKVYDLLMWLSQVVLPALGVLYAALAGIWGLPGAVQVSGTILAFDTFLGVVLKASQSKYNKSK